MKNVLIIGSESTLGKHYIKKFKTSYNKIIYTDIKKSDKQNDDFFQADLSNLRDIEKLGEFVHQKKIKINEVIFFTGVNYASSFFSVDDYTWDNSLDTNVKSLLFILKNIYKYLDKTVSIVAIASQNGVVAHDNRIDYGTSKAALLHLVKNLSVEFSKDTSRDIRINAISPSYIESEKNMDYLHSPKGMKLLQRIPYKKFVAIEDVSEATYFLLSKKSKAIRGHNLVIDYGYTIV